MLPIACKKDCHSPRKPSTLTPTAAPEQQNHWGEAQALPTQCSLRSHDQHSLQGVICSNWWTRVKALSLRVQFTLVCQESLPPQSAFCFYYTLPSLSHSSNRHSSKSNYFNVCIISFLVLKTFPFNTGLIISQSKKPENLQMESFTCEVKHEANAANTRIFLSLEFKTSSNATLAKFLMPPSVYS